MLSFDGASGRIEHYAYGPGNKEKQFLGASALKKAVEYAEKMNRAGAKKLSKRC